MNENVDTTRTVQSKSFRSALNFCNLANNGKLKLPVRVRCGNSSFKITHENLDHISLGVLMAAEWKAKDE